mgnify:CR=1 FL=1
MSNIDFIVFSSILITIAVYGAIKNRQNKNLKSYTIGFAGEENEIDSAINLSKKFNVDNINKDAFTPFDSITEAQAFEWMFKEMGDYHKGELEHYTIKQAMKNDQPSRKSGLPSNW